MMESVFPGINQVSSALGFGCMRFPTINGKIDEPEAVKMIHTAIDRGVRYIDTAYPYHQGESELVVGRALQGGYRERVLLATKLPVWKVEKYEDMMQLLDEQLQKLQVDYVDFYLLHALDAEEFHKMQKLDYKRFFSEAMAQGKIRYPAFSFHDNAETFLEILHDYDWKMCQVQMNILDSHMQATVDGIREAGKAGVGVVIMEPLRGGLLASPPANIQAIYSNASAQRSLVEWSFRYLYTMPEVITILSGMSSMEQLLDNLNIFDRAARDTLTAEEVGLYEEVKETYLSKVKTRCTGCRYCQPCPKGVAIPSIFNSYDEYCLKPKKSYFETYQQFVLKISDASHCAKCGQCEAACPQHLPIITYLQEIHRTACP